MQGEGGNIEELDLKKPQLANQIREIGASYDSSKEWRQDSTGYWLFRIDADAKEIHAGFCRKNNIIEVKITGTCSEAIQNTIVREGLVGSLQHAAYIGHELLKAEVALKLGIHYIQDMPLNLESING
jgi:dihydropteroate synthase